MDLKKVIRGRLPDNHSYSGSDILNAESSLETYLQIVDGNNICNIDIGKPSSSDIILEELGFVRITRNPGCYTIYLEYEPT